MSTVVRSVAEEFGHEHSVMMLLDEEGSRLYTIASHGFADEGVGSEVAVGEGPVGVAAVRCTPIRVGNLQHIGRYTNLVRRSFEEAGDIGPGRDIPFPWLPEARPARRAGPRHGPARRGAHGRLAELSGVI